MQPFKIIIFSVGGFLAVCLAFLLREETPKASKQPANISFMNGVSFVAPPRPVSVSSFDSLQQIHANWIAVMPFAFSENNTPVVNINEQHRWWGERMEGVYNTIQMAHRKGIKVMLKPHLWIKGGWAGDFKLSRESDWEIWEQSYLNYIIPLAKMADSLDVEVFCIGLELKNVVNLRPECWQLFIRSVRKVYGGAVTYAANWDNFDNFPAWDQLDLIGINAYFPLCSKSSPTTTDIREGWTKYRQKIKNIYDKYKKPVIFTEFGYRSIDGAAEKPWENPGFNKALNKPNYKIQLNAYEALFETFWKEPWFAGGFLWKWYDNDHDFPPYAEIDYTPQRKPAERVIAQWYAIR